MNIFLNVIYFPSVDCVDPTCTGHGGCVDGQCVCRAGWTGLNCSQVDHKVFTCLPDCSGHGHYDLHSSKCVCESFWSGENCNQRESYLIYAHFLVFKTDFYFQFIPI